MIFGGIDFHNVAELIPAEGGGWQMSRFPKEVLEGMDPGAGRVSHYATGVELRFKIRGDRAVLKLRGIPEAEAHTLYIFYGAIQGGWQNSSKAIGAEETTIAIDRPKNLDVLKTISREHHLGFNPEVVRVLLPYGTCIYQEIEGDVVPPEPADCPAQTYLAYGSSITHGSLSLAAPYAYPVRIAQKFHCDTLNFGMAGTARAEAAMAEYIVRRNDWDFASVELGINMLSFSAEAFLNRVDRFLQILSQDPRPVFLTSIFGFNDPKWQSQAERFRGIMSEMADKYPKFTFTDGRELLNRADYISQDLTHPTLEGVEQIADRWYQVMQPVIAREMRESFVSYVR